MIEFKHADRQRHRVSPARLVQNDFRALEATIDEAIASGGELIGRMMRVGQLASLSPGDGQKAVEAAAACLNAGIQMRAHALDAHEELRSIAGRVRLRELGWGDLVDSPSSSSVKTTGVTALRVVDRS